MLVQCNGTKIPSKLQVMQTIETVPLVRLTLTLQLIHTSFVTLYLANQLQPVAALESRRRLRPSASARLDITRVQRTTIGDRAFCVGGPHVWNSLSSST